MEHSITGERSWHMDNFELKATDVQKSMRSYPGVDKDQYYTLEDIRDGDHSFHDGRASAGGMTETDADTSGQMDGPYTHVNKKKGKYEVVRNKLSATKDMYNTDKSMQKIKDPLAKGKTRG